MIPPEAVSVGRVVDPASPAGHLSEVAYSKHPKCLTAEA